MHGELRATALCPVCGDILIAISDTRARSEVRREYYHAKATPRSRRRRYCVKVFTDLDQAALERKTLEAVPFFGRRPVRMSCKGKRRANA